MDIFQMAVNVKVVKVANDNMAITAKTAVLYASQNALTTESNLTKLLHIL